MVFLAGGPLICGPVRFALCAGLEQSIGLDRNISVSGKILVLPSANLGFIDFTHQAHGELKN